MNKQQKFYKKFHELVESLRIEKPKKENRLGYTFETETKAGIFAFQIHKKDYGLFSIFGRFEEPKKARKICECNPYSGKYNFHCNGMDECLMDFKNFLKKIK